MSTHCQLTLFMPNLLTAAEPPPALKMLLQRAGKVTASTVTEWDLWGYSKLKPKPMAAVCAAADGLSVKKAEWWLRADPVELQADQATVYLANTAALALTDTETEALVNSLNDFLQQDGLQLIAPHPHRWYVKLAADPQIETYAPDTLLGQSVRHYLAAGEQYRQWRRLFSELQILLQQHPVNLRRQAQSQPVVNGLWFWGQGCLPEAPQTERRKVWSDSLITRGLAAWAGVAIASLPATFSDCLTQMQLPGTYLLTAETVTENNIQDWEQQWFQPVAQALRVGQLEKITLYIKERTWIVDAADIKKWWRSAIPL